MVNDVLSAVATVAVDMRRALSPAAPSPTLAAQAAATGATATGATGGGKPMPPSGEATPPESAPRPEVQLPDVSRAVQNLNQFMESSRRSLNFRIDEASGRTIITVVNPTTKEIVRQIPPEEVLTIARTLREAGILFDAMA